MDDPTKATFKISGTARTDVTTSIIEGPTAFRIDGVCTFHLSDGSITFDDAFEDNPDGAAQAFIQRVKELGFLTA